MIRCAPHFTIHLLIWTGDVERARYIIIIDLSIIGMSSTSSRLFLSVKNSENSAAKSLSENII